MFFQRALLGGEAGLVVRQLRRARVGERRALRDVAGDARALLLDARQSRAGGPPIRGRCAQNLLGLAARAVGCGPLALRRRLLARQARGLRLLQRLRRGGVGRRRLAPRVGPPDLLQQAGQLGVLHPFAQHHLAQLVERPGQQGLRARALLDQPPPSLARVQLAPQVDVDVADRFAEPAEARSGRRGQGGRAEAAALPARQAPGRREGRPSGDRSRTGRRQHRSRIRPRVAGAGQAPQRGQRTVGLRELVTALRAERQVVGIFVRAVATGTHRGG